MGEIPCARPEAATTLGELKRDAVPTDDAAVVAVVYSELQDTTVGEASGSERSMEHASPGGQEGCTDNPRDTRVKILDAIVTCLQTKKPDWQKARILHLSTQLEESMFLCKTSLAGYGDASTLPARVNKHCLLLAQRKQANPIGNPPAAVPVAFGNLLGSAPAPSLGGRGAPAVRIGYDAPRCFESVRTERSGSYAGTGAAWVVPQQQNGSSHENVHENVSPQPPILRHPSSEAGAAEAAVSGRQPDGDYILNSLVVNSIVESRGGGGPGQEHATSDGLRAKSVASGTNLGAGAVAWTGGEERGRVPASYVADVVDRSEEGPLAGAVHHRRNDVGAERRQAAGDKRRDAAYAAEVKQHALRLFQCRVLLLSHASECKAEENTCQLSPLCDSVRQLLDHMKDCRNRIACGFPHCASSKAVLQHQHMCDDSACRLCGSVRDLTQRCFWANARHAHKRRLQESHELRRKKRQSEGKAVAPPRKPQAEKVKTGRDLCLGLDEAGNDLGDITLGFFLRQDEAVKARKMSGDDADSRMEASSPPGPVSSPPSKKKKRPGQQQQQQQQQHRQHGPAHVTGAYQSTAMLRDATASANAVTTAAVAPPATAATSFAASCTSASSATASTVPRGAKKQKQGGRRASSRPAAAAAAANNYSGLQLASTAPPWPQQSKPLCHGGGAGVAREKEEDVSGGGAEARAVVAWSGGGRGPAAHGGGLTVIIPPPGVMAGHLRSPSEMMLDEIAESLADTTRKPSFARMQSVQAFLNDHGELRESPSFGDVSALMGHWMNAEDGAGEDDHLGLSGAFSF